MQNHLHHARLDFYKFSVHFTMPSLRYTLGTPLDFCKILVPYCLHKCFFISISVPCMHGSKVLKKSTVRCQQNLSIFGRPELAKALDIISNKIVHTLDLICAHINKTVDTAAPSIFCHHPYFLFSILYDVELGGPLVHIVFMSYSV